MTKLTIDQRVRVACAVTGLDIEVADGILTYLITFDDRESIRVPFGDNDAPYKLKLVEWLADRMPSLDGDTANALLRSMRGGSEDRRITMVFDLIEAIKERNAGALESLCFELLGDA